MVLRTIKSKRTKALLKRFKEDDEQPIEEEEDQQQSEQEDVEQKPKKQSIKDLLSGVLAKKTKAASGMLAEKSGVLAKLAEDKQNQKEHQIKKKLKKSVPMKAHVDPRLQNNAILERQLKVTAAKGVVKVFQAIKKVQQEGIN